MDWSLAAKIAGGGFGVTIFVLLVLAVVSWVVGLIIRKTAAKPEEDSSKG